MHCESRQHAERAAHARTHISTPLTRTFTIIWVRRRLAVGSALFPGTSTIDQLARIMRATGPLPPALAAQMMADRNLCPLAAQQRQPAKRTLRERLPVSRLGFGIFALMQEAPQSKPRNAAPRDR